MASLDFCLRIGVDVLSRKLRAAKAMKFFNLDLHIGVIGDIKRIMETMGHEVTSWSISSHAWLLNAKQPPVDEVTAKTWRSIDDAMCERFYRRYKEELAHYDGFIVTHTPCFSMLFARWKKPMLCVASTRYEHPFTNNTAAWMHFNDYLRSAIDSGQVVPIANNVYDAEYARLFTLRDWQVIPSLCEYTGAAYTGARSDLLYVSKLKPMPAISSLVDKRHYFGPSFWQRVMKRVGLPFGQYGYSWQELADFKGAVWIPYNVSLMSLFEMYMAAVPMFFPSLDFMMELYSLHNSRGVLSELSFRQVLRLPPGSAVPCPGPDPNNYLDIAAVRQWLQKADFYDLGNLAHLTYFTSFNELRELVRSVDYLKIHRLMVEHNKLRTERVYRLWKEVIANL